MKFKCPAKDLKEALATVGGVINERASLAALTCVRIDAKQDSLVLTGSSLNLNIRHELKCNVERAGSIGLPFKKLMSVATRLGNSDLDVSAINPDQARLVSGDFNYTMTGFRFEDMPETIALEREYQCEVESIWLRNALRFVRPAECRNESLDNKFGINFLFQDETLEIAATNGHQFAKANIQLTGDVPKGLKFFLPPATADQLRKIEGDGDLVSVTWCKSSVHFNLGSTEVFSKLKEAKFPAYESLIYPLMQLEPVVELEREALKERTERVMIGGEKMNLKSTNSGLYLHCASKADGDCRDHLPMTCPQEAEICLNPAYLAGALTSFDEDTVEAYISDSQPFILRSGTKVQIIMGIRVA
ncbi:MAG: DNA polymerase III subunit beta [Verrucomicrobiota bacterium]